MMIGFYFQTIPFDTPDDNNTDTSTTRTSATRTGPTRTSTTSTANTRGRGTCMKYIMFFINLALLIGVLGASAVGYWMHYYRNYTIKVFDVDIVYIYKETKYIIIGMGCLAGLITLIGCWSSIRNAKCCLRMYTLMVSVVLGVTLTGIAFLYIYRDRAYPYLQGRLLDEIKACADDTFLIEKWDTLHLTWKCCGVRENAFDWPNNLPPKSCCGNNAYFICTSASYSLYKASCLTVFFQKLGKYFYYGVYIGVSLMFILILQMILAWKLAQKL